MNRNQDTRRSSLRALVLRAAALLLLAFALLAPPAGAQMSCASCTSCNSCSDNCSGNNGYEVCGAHPPCRQVDFCSWICRPATSDSTRCSTQSSTCEETTCGAFLAGSGSGGTCDPGSGNAWAWESMEYFHYDALGSVRLVVDFPVSSSNYTITRHDYVPFGEEIQAGTFGRTADLGYGVDPTPRRFTGKERDTESGLDYFGARYYSGAQGRWTTADKPFADQQAADPQSWNLYAYVRNRPLTHVDPNGEGAQDVVVGSWNFTRTKKRWTSTARRKN